MSLSACHKFESMRNLVTLKQILSGKLHTLLYHESETEEAADWKQYYFLKSRTIFASNSSDPGFLEDDSADVLEQAVSNLCITACFCFLPAAASSFPSMTSPSASCQCAFFKVALLSSSILLMAIHACIPAFAWPNTERPKMWAAALEVQQPLKVLSQKLQTANFAPLFFRDMVQPPVFVTAALKMNEKSLLSPSHVSARRSCRFTTWRNTKFMLCTMQPPFFLAL